MTGFQPSLITPKPTAADPTKHVNYAQGMVLGVADFVQEHAYLAGHQEWLARDALGYGTVSGLAVAVPTNTAKREVVVAPGSAVTPRGQLVRVPSAQCADLNAWLAANQKGVDQHLLVDSPLTKPRVRIYVVLCYRECPTDPLPIPGEPCRDEKDLLAPSRITDDFHLELRFRAPDEREELAVRSFGHWLRRHINVTASPGSSISEAEFLLDLRSAAAQSSPPLDPDCWPVASPPSAPPDYMIDASPPGPIPVYSGDLCHYLNLALRLWVTELRPRWRPDWLDRHCPPGQIAPAPNEGDCLLLACVALPLIHDPPASASWKVDGAPGAKIEIDETLRPFFAHLRMLQELITCPPGQAAAAVSSDIVAGDVIGTLKNTHVVRLSGTPVDPAPPKAGQVLTFAGGAWRGQAPAPPADVPTPATNPPLGGTAFGLPAALGVVKQRYALEDHAHATPAFPNVVERPAGTGPYLIVAAGLFALDVNLPGPPAFGGLRLTGRALSGQSVLLDMTFNGYIDPAQNTKVHYVVKALPTPFDGVPTIVNFVRFLPGKEGFRLQFSSAIAQLPQILKGLGLMVEVSEFNL